jgi:hypothetical protein
MERITLFIMSVLFVVSCNNESVVNRTVPEERQSIKLEIPGISEVSVYSTASTSECRIDSIWVLEFSTSGTLVNSQLVEGTDIYYNGQASQFLPELSFKPVTGNRIICVANSEFKGSTVSSSLTLSGIDAQFPITKQYYLGGESLPLYGEIASWSATNYTCEMIRSVAKIQVEYGTSVVIDTMFSVVNSYWFSPYNIGNGGKIQPSSVPVGIVPNTHIDPAMPEKDKFYPLQIDTTENLKTVYIHEYPSSNTDINGSTISNAQFNKDRLSLLLLLNNDVGYRLDFYDQKADTFLNIKRNHHYTFVINKIKSPYYGGTNVIRENPGSNLEYEVVVKDNATVVESNGQYAIVTNIPDTIHVGSTAVADSVIGFVRYQLGAGFPAPVGLTTEISASGLTVSPATFSTSNANVTITINAGFANGYIEFKYGNAYHKTVVLP